MTNDIKNHRAVRSYVLRAGRMTAAQEKALQDLWPIYGVDAVKPLTLTTKTPTVLEIGFGMGQSLAAQAKTFPDTLYIGIEVHKPCIGSLLLQMQKENIANIRIFQVDAVTVLTDKIPDHCLDKIQIFFPDPWPKKRHHKRRLIQAAFIRLLHQKLKPNGILHIATDWENYAEHITAVIAESQLFTPTAISHNRPPTKFERRGLKLGHQVWDLVFKAIKQ